MDLQTAQRLSGRHWQIAKLAALLFFGIACVLLASSLPSPQGDGSNGPTGAITVER